MPNFNPLIRAMEKDLKKRNTLKEYQRTMSNSVLDKLSVYVCYRNNSEQLNFTIEELDNYTPDWIRAKYYLIDGEY